MTAGSRASGNRHSVPIALGLCLALLFGCRAGPEQGAAEDTLRAEIQALLEDRAQALTGGDVETFLEHSTGTALEFDRALAEGLAQVPIAGVGLRVAGAGMPGANLPVNDVRVELRYTFQNMPDNPFTATLMVTFDRSGGQIHVADARFDGLLPVWATGPLQFAQSDHFLTLFRPGMTNADAMVAVAEQARTELAERLPGLSDGVYLLLLARDQADYGDFSRSSLLVDGSRAAEATFNVSVLPQSIEVGARQIVVDVAKLQRDRNVLPTFKHELAHLALAADTMPFTPAWVAEAGAMYLAGERPDFVWRQGVANGSFREMRFADLSRQLQLTGHHGTGAQASEQYAYAAAAAWYLGETYGETGLLDFYRYFARVSALTVYQLLPSGQVAFSEEPSMQALAAETTTRALDEIFGIDESELDGRVQEWIEQQVNGRRSG